MMGQIGKHIHHYWYCMCNPVAIARLFVIQWKECLFIINGVNEMGLSEVVLDWHSLLG